jgi:uncharacterized protein (TIGR00251 family)
VDIPVTDGAAGAVFAVRVAARAGRTAVAGTRGDALLVRLSAAPVDGAANEALVAFLADLFDRPRRDVAILSGHRARDKRVRIGGLSADAAAVRLRAILAGT